MSSKVFYHTISVQLVTVYVSSVNDLSLFEYLSARTAYCRDAHTDPCNKCSGMLKVANTTLEQGCTLSDAFRLASPMVKYTAEHAGRKLLQMPLVCIRIGDPCSSCYLVFLLC